jgi:predicted acyltransferase (DUF342 family)
MDDKDAVDAKDAKKSENEFISTDVKNRAKYRQMKEGLKGFGQISGLEVLLREDQVNEAQISKILKQMQKWKPYQETSSQMSMQYQINFSDSEIKTPTEKKRNYLFKK